MPFFSIITPTYNRDKFIGKAIESVMDQTYHDWELIIVDDGSTDKTKEIVDSYKDKRIRYIYQQNAERSVARNNGIAHAIGKYVFFLDSDDYYLPNHLSAFFEKINETNEPVAMFVSGIYEVSESGKRKRILFDQEYIGRPLLYYWENTILASTAVCVHHEIVKENKFIPEFNIWEDNHLWLRILSQFPFYCIEKYTAICIQHADSGVVKDLAMVKLEKVKKYISAINHLFSNYPFILQHLSLKMKRTYIDKKYNMFIYQARENGLYMVAIHLSIKAIINKISIKNFLLVPKIIVHAMIHFIRKSE